MSAPDHDTRPFLVWHINPRLGPVAVDACDEEQAVVAAAAAHGWNPDNLDARPMVARDYKCNGGQGGAPCPARGLDNGFCGEVGR